MPTKAELEKEVAKLERKVAKLEDDLAAAKAAQPDKTVDHSPVFGANAVPLEQR